MTSGQKLPGYGSESIQDVKLYRSIVGALQYVIVTRKSYNLDLIAICDVN
ncbi:hypothetical protein AAG906_000622 [Vitis piasezkii]